MTNPALLAVATAVVAAGGYYLVRRSEDDIRDCFDRGMPADVRKELIVMLRPEEGDVTPERLLERATSYRNTGAILAKDFPKAAACTIRRAEKLEKVLRDAAKKAGDPEPTPKKKKPTTKKKAPPKTTPTKKTPAKTTPVKASVVGTFKLPTNEGTAREKRILKLFGEGKFAPIVWEAVNCGRPGGKSCTVFVSSDALMLQDGDERLRVTVQHDTAEKLAVLLGSKLGEELLLPTTRISDLAFLQANNKLPPMMFKASPVMSKTPRMYDHNRRVEKAIGGRGGLSRPVGKDWTTSNRFFSSFNKHAPEASAINSGWQDPQGPFKSPGGVNVRQPLSSFHGVGHTDYSQTVTLVRGDVLVDGKKRRLVDVLRDPTLSKLVSDEGPIKRIRHPALPDAPVSALVAFA